MHKMIVAIVLFATVTPQAAGQSPYAGQEQRPIKSLSQQDVDALRKGRGMGFAKLAELNGYPGPKHVLELSEALGLSETQLAETRTVFRQMQYRAVRLGEAIVAAERRLDEAFAQHRVSADSLKDELAEIGRLRAELRYVHLEAHLEQKQLLSAEQIAKYNSLRGYRLEDKQPADHSSHRD